MTKDEMIMLSATILYARHDTEPTDRYNGVEHARMEVAVGEANRLWLVVLSKRPQVTERDH